MKKLILLLLFIPYIFTSCSNLKHSKFKKKSNVKEFVISKYGEPNIIYNNEKLEVWKYESDNSIKNNRTIVFKEKKIISNQIKLKPIPYVITNVLGYAATVLAAMGLIAIGFGHI